MYRCNNCKASFEHYDTVIEDTGERWYVCPYCKEPGFNEKRVKNDRFLVIDKALVIDYAVSAIAFLNTKDIEAAKETLIELIGEMADSMFEYKSSLEKISSEEEKNELISEIQTAVEFKKI